jgi:hypothetical protein
MPLLAISGPPTLAFSCGVSGAVGEVAALGLGDDDASVFGLAAAAAAAVAAAAAAALVTGTASVASPEIAVTAAMATSFRRTSDFIGVPLISA